MLAIKLKPIGKKHQRTFRIIVAERRSKLDGRFIADLGWANPHSDIFLVRGEDALRWIQKGAQPTDSVHNILVRAGVLKAEKKQVHKRVSKDASSHEVVSKSEDAAEINEISGEAKSGEEQAERAGGNQAVDAPKESAVNAEVNIDKG